MHNFTLALLTDNQVQHVAIIVYYRSTKEDRMLLNEMLLSDCLRMVDLLHFQQAITPWAGLAYCGCESGLRPGQ